MQLHLLYQAFECIHCFIHANFALQNSRKVHSLVHNYTDIEIFKSIYMNFLVHNEFRANQLSVFFETKPKPVMLWVSSSREEKYSLLTEETDVNLSLTSHISNVIHNINIKFSNIVYPNLIEFNSGGNPRRQERR
jgi:hypothetical protein